MYKVEVRFADGDQALVGIYPVEAQPNNLSERLDNATIIDRAKARARRDLNGSDQYRPLTGRIQ